jgi:threonine dehydrogenase-like Zn-dependent dehydrogenase
MKALTWQGTNNVQIDQVKDPKIEQPSDVIIEVTASAICGSDLQFYHGYVPSIEKGDVLGHEFAGRVVEAGSDVKKVKVGDRIVVPFTISCDLCAACKADKFSLCLTKAILMGHKRQRLSAILQQDYLVTRTFHSSILEVKLQDRAP